MSLVRGRKTTLRDLNVKSPKIQWAALADFWMSAGFVFYFFQFLSVMYVLYACLYAVCKVQGVPGGGWTPAINP